MPENEETKTPRAYVRQGEPRPDPLELYPAGSKERAWHLKNQGWSIREIDAVDKECAAFLRENNRQKQRRHQQRKRERLAAERAAAEESV